MKRASSVFVFAVVAIAAAANVSLAGAGEGKPMGPGDAVTANALQLIDQGKGDLVEYLKSI